MAETFAIHQSVLDALRGMGRAPDTSMRAEVDRWWGWYTATDEWYTLRRTFVDHAFRVRRMSVHPARSVCREWASAILSDDGTTVTVAEAPGDVAEADAWLAGWMARNRFVPKAQMALERAFALGTAAMSLWFRREGEGLSIRPRRYDARMVLPLSWDDDEVSECAFVTTASLAGRRVQQLQAHVLGDDGAYHILTRLFDARDGREATDDSVIADFATGSARPTFCVLRPGLDNVFADGTAMGQSVFADAIDAVKGVDNAWDSLQTELDTTKVKVFMSDDLIDMVDGDGRPVPIPMSPDNLVIRKVAQSGVESVIETFQPKIRAAEIASSLNTSLAMLGQLTGFGTNYLRIDKDGSIKTAREVSSDNSDFARNIRKHENEVGPALEGLLGALVDVATGGSGSAVSVRFDDSVVTDTQTEKQTLMAEVAAGVRAPWEYRVRFLGESEEAARAAIAEISSEPAEVGTLA